MVDTVLDFHIAPKSKATKGLAWLKWTRHNPTSMMSFHLSLLIEEVPRQGNHTQATGYLKIPFKTCF